ncbi:MAG: hypothetical protein A2X51_14390 [Candidatus Rokubacteria bacterium GWC2_70_24]|nr:MAG: hypothetical protein A2X53_01270 [Candidatus Rokubacteria bacterium GWA2_70_23]OGK87864.1 MAG: hypothetical protein A2X51_14390 [Candidatus Rokubacteria bacterium GWC2_70_24]OGK91019.1 MAG: hypothetical protein A2X50_03350 [Candidatus Rokubacteria bacterium GWF2_70_14]HAM56340.1 hypothetical protein [Candidatus Rokubacteria bacterium]
MGEAPRKPLAAVAAKGHPTPLPPHKNVRIVPNIKLENVPADGVTIMMVGGDFPELAVALAPAEARQLIASLMKHIALLEK